MLQDKDLDNFSPLKLVQIFDHCVKGVKLPIPQSLAYSHKAKRFFAVEKNQIIAIDSQQERDPKRSTKNIPPGLLEKSLMNTSSDEDIDANWGSHSNNIYLNFKRKYDVVGTNTTVSGNGNTIFTFIPNSTGLNTSGNVISFWNGTAAGLDSANSIDGFAIG
ncbi:hypothetical protein H6G41_14765 [Tolypothrix sp. FACHB-123]|uniref:hypothetical protein n=1 Tax=Tolypothrix sp. FACHB-123 TaxID=2692868 RepID=UPI00168A3482|nr:hypothetical protein [Tolypothrix sp. FACHB-123]MBD2355864.1 hypothetical protein [Tolypothrix sp. FACHB-123]